jgi:hypothetical protein
VSTQGKRKKMYTCSIARYYNARKLTIGETCYDLSKRKIITYKKIFCVFPSLLCFLQRGNTLGDIENQLGMQKLNAMLILERHMVEAFFVEKISNRKGPTILFCPFFRSSVLSSQSRRPVRYPQFKSSNVFSNFFQIFL